MSDYEQYEPEGIEEGYAEGAYDDHEGEDHHAEEGAWEEGDDELGDLLDEVLEYRRQQGEEEEAQERIVGELETAHQAIGRTLTTAEVNAIAAVERGEADEVTIHGYDQLSERDRRAKLLEVAGDLQQDFERARVDPDRVYDLDNTADRHAWMVERLNNPDAEWRDVPDDE